MATTIAKVPPVSRDAQSSILDLEPDAESLDWICYRLRGGRDPARDAATPSPRVTSTSLPGLRPGREDIEKALGQLVSLGMLTCSGRRWSITAKGHAAVVPPHRPGAAEAPRPCPPRASARVTSR